MSEELSMKDLHYRTNKGRIQSFVAREREKSSRISKTLKTAMRKGHLSLEDVNRIFLEVKKESVEDFSSSTNYPSRKERLERLIELLH